MLFPPPRLNQQLNLHVSTNTKRLCLLSFLDRVYESDRNGDWPFPHKEKQQRTGPWLTGSLHHGGELWFQNARQVPHVSASSFSHRSACGFGLFPSPADWGWIPRDTARTLRWKGIERGRERKLRSSSCLFQALSFSCWPILEPRCHTLTPQRNEMKQNHSCAVY